MPTLNWIGKDRVVNHHLDVPYRTLEEQYRYGDPEAAGQNKIIHGDNLEALKSLLPEYEGKIKCIYIDPPYNTGNEAWVYNDNVNHPKIKKWLGDVVGKEGEDLTRHDKWLCMMYPRLKLLNRLLMKGGAIFVSIDDDELRSLLWLLDEIFGRNSRLATFVWKRRQQTDSRNVTNISVDHEYVLAYGKGEVVFAGRPINMSKYKNPDSDPRGAWYSDNLTGLASATERPNLHYEITNPETGITYPPSPTRGWAVSKERFLDYIADDRILWPAKPSGRPRLKRFAKEASTTGFSSFLDVGYTSEGTRAVQGIFGEKVFPFPKPVSLVRELVTQSCSSGDIVLDSFAGSGTTAHAVLDLNNVDGRELRFILVEMEDYADSITAERVKRVIDGYGEGKNTVEGAGGGFTFHELGEPLFFPDGSINDSLGIDHLRQYIWFTETRSALPATTETKNPQFIGSQDGTSYYLHHQSDGLGTLDFEFLKTIDKKDEQYVIYADRCHVDEELLRRHGVIFKKVPRDIVRF
jgi:adenine-specific DNA-methyltransferase